MFVPESLTPEQFDACASLLEAYPYKPYGHYRKLIADGRIEQFFLAQVRAGLVNHNQSALWIPGLDGALALAMWTRLAWDSEQLGYGAGRLDYLVASGAPDQQWELKKCLLRALLQECAQDGISHLSARVDSADLATVHLLEQHGFITMDSILTFSRNVKEARCPTQSNGVNLRLSAPADIEQIKAIARSSYVYDRFHSDPRVPKEVADELHAVWMENACRGTAADAVVVGEIDGRVSSYVACKVNYQATSGLGLGVGTIVLVATAPAARHKGLARIATYGAIDWLKKQGVSLVEVGTQLRNIAASRLYESCGFGLVASSVSLRRSIEDARQVLAFRTPLDRRGRNRRGS